MKGILLGPSNSFHPSFLLGTKVSQYFESWTPLLDFHLPIEHHRGGHDNLKTYIPMTNDFEAADTELTR